MTDPLSQDDLGAMLEWFWHPVATSAELEAAGGLLGTRLLGRELVVARLSPGSVAVLTDRCPHRSTRLSIGCIDRGAIRCAYHGWRWDAQGRCVEIPSAPATAVPARFRQEAFAAEERHGLVWVRLRQDAPTAIPPMPAGQDASMRVVAGEPYVWPTSAPRRVENFVDLAHFAWVHDGTLGTRGEPVPPEPTISRRGGELRFGYESPPLADQATAALVGASEYRIPMPLTVDIAFRLAGRPDARRHLWMTATPVASGVCRTYWCVARNDELDRPDQEFLDFQGVVVAEDEPVVCSQTPPEIPLEIMEEFHVKADKVSLEYRRWLRDLTAAARLGVGALAEVLGAPAPVAGGHVEYAAGAGALAGQVQ
jgi:phenylpropionate dioxygenase-like ring-hydroxylating dioxygenase large terminal subunit